MCPIRQRGIVVLALLATLVLLCPPVSGNGLTIEALDSGWYDQGGNHSPSLTNYICGYSGPTESREYRNFFVFDLSSVSETVVLAYLEIYNPQDGYSSPDPFETFTLNEVGTAIDFLRAGGSGLVGVFEDLGNGQVFGSVDVTAANWGIKRVALNEACLAAINATAGQFAVGGNITTLDGDSQQIVFGWTNDGYPRRLVLYFDFIIFEDDFESGDTLAWSSTTPDRPVSVPGAE